MMVNIIKTCSANTPQDIYFSRRNKENIIEVCESRQMGHKTGSNDVCIIEQRNTN